MELELLCKHLRSGSVELAKRTAAQKNLALTEVKKALLIHSEKILAANVLDVQKARADGMKETLVDRLLITQARIEGIAVGLDKVIAQSDPVGQTVSGWKTEVGLDIRQVRVPLGVVCVIYESRPNVTVDVFALAYKSGNAVLLRGSSSALQTNRVLVQIIQEALAAHKDAGAVPEAIALADSGSRDEVDWILNAVGKIDVVLPRGGQQLISTVVSKARIPVIETGSGVCHLYVDADADLTMAAHIAANAKLQRPGVCNAIETLLVHRKSAEVLLQKIHTLFAAKAQFRCCPESLAILTRLGSTCAVAACDEDFGYEFLDNILAVKLVSSVEEAIEHINAHNTKHSESIVTASFEAARLFQQEVDAACVYVNASTRFTDGEMFGFGAELGISTQKMHVRGPMGLTALTSIKYLIDGKGQTR